MHLHQAVYVALWGGRKRREMASDMNEECHMPRNFEEARETTGKYTGPLFRNIWHLVGGKDIRGMLDLEDSPTLEEPRTSEMATKESIPDKVSNIDNENGFSTVLEHSPAIVAEDDSAKYGKDERHSGDCVVAERLETEASLEAMCFPSVLTLEAVLSADVTVEFFPPKHLVEEALKEQKKLEHCDVSRIPHMSQGLVDMTISAKIPSLDMNGVLTKAGQCRRSCINYLRHHHVRILGRRYDTVLAELPKDPQNPKDTIGDIEIRAKVKREYSSEPKTYPTKIRSISMFRFDIRKETKYIFNVGSGGRNGHPSPEHVEMRDMSPRPVADC